jgi:methyltransferase-like protein 23
MSLIKRDEKILYTSAGDFPIDEYRLKFDSSEWKILHVNAAVSRAQENHFLLKISEKLPYGVSLWASSIALAHEIASRGTAFQQTSVLELGAGTGLPGIVAASFGAQVVQTDRNELVMSLARRNLELNKVSTIRQKIVDWTTWNDSARYDYLLGSDILYGEEMQPYLRRIFETNLAKHGKILIADPFRQTSIDFLEKLQSQGWTITINKWQIGDESDQRPIGVFELKLV